MINSPRQTISEQLILAGSIFFVIGVMWMTIISYFGIGLGLIGIAVNFTGRRFSSPLKALLILICAFLIWGFILSFTIAARFNEALTVDFNYAAHWLFPLALGLWLKDRYRIGIIYLFVILALAVGLLSLGAFAGLIYNPNLSKEGMLWGFHHHIAFAVILLAAFHLVYSFALNPETSNKRTILYLLVGAILILLVVLTGSRAYWIAGAISIAGATIYKAISGHRRALALSFLGIGIVAVALSVAAFPQVRQRIQMSGADDPNFIYRKNMATMAFAIIKDHPIVGIGPGQVPYAKTYYDEMESRHLPLETGYLEKKHLHNMYLQIAAEFGIPGLVIFAAILFLAFRILMTAAEGRGPRSAIALGVFWTVVAIAIGEIFDCLLRGPSIAIMTFWLLGISAGAAYIDKKV